MRTSCLSTQNNPRVKPEPCLLYQLEYDGISYCIFDELGIMSDQKLVHESIDAFFSRTGLTSHDKEVCYNFIEELYPDVPCEPAKCQGYCSMTMLVGDNIVIQFRPYSHRLSLRVTRAAQEVYGALAPKTEYVATLPGSGLLVYAMERIDGVSLKELEAISSTGSTCHRARLCKDFAAFLSISWYHKEVTEVPLGLVGKTIVPRLKSLSTALPNRFQATARHILRNIQDIEGLPSVLSHGDIVAANIMVEPLTGRLTGFVDWAEAERLPFGICIYGLEEILGEMTPGGFQYYVDADDLREMFWAELKDRIPELKLDCILGAVKAARDLGVLLWHGIAFDNGAINRVVEEGRDIDEIHRLDAFLGTAEQQGSRHKL